MNQQKTWKIQHEMKWKEVMRNLIMYDAEEFMEEYSSIMSQCAGHDFEQNLYWSLYSIKSTEQNVGMKLISTQQRNDMLLKLLKYFKTNNEIYLEDFLPDQKQENIWYREREDYKYEHKGFPI
jgi:hypothetical protein